MLRSRLLQCTLNRFLTSMKVEIIVSRSLTAKVKKTEEGLLQGKNKRHLRKQGNKVGFKVKFRTKFK